MVLESTMVCVDNSDYMRNGDFVPTRLQAQQDAVNLVCHAKTRSNPENNVGLVTLTNIEVLSTLTTDVGRLLAKLHQVQPKGDTNFISGLRVAHLALKHRQGKNHKMRIICFVGSPVDDDEKELVKLAKRLKKEKVNVDVVNFGEDSMNTDKLTTFVNTINGKDGTGSHLVTVSSGPMLSDTLVSSPIVAGEDGSGAVPSGMSGFEFGVDPNEDPELALALRVSMEEQRSRQEDEAQKVAAQSAAEVTPMVTEDTAEEAMLKQALEMSQPESTTPAAVERDFSSMSEEDQIAYAMQLSMQPGGEDAPSPTLMETDDSDKPDAAGAAAAATPAKAEEPKNSQDEDYSEVFNDPEFLQSVLEGLPGVDPRSEAIQNAMGQLARKDSDKKDDKKKEEKK